MPKLWELNKGIHLHVTVCLPMHVQRVKFNICLVETPILLKLYRGFSHFHALKNGSAPPREYLAFVRLIHSVPANQPPPAKCFEVFSYTHCRHTDCYYLCILYSKQSSRALFSWLEEWKKAVFSKMKWSTLLSSKWEIQISCLGVPEEHYH